MRSPPVVEIRACKGVFDLQEGVDSNFDLIDWNILKITDLNWSNSNLELRIGVIPNRFDEQHQASVMETSAIA
jgi:hypothetical protein